MEPVSLAQLRANTLQVFRRGGGSRPDVLLVSHHDAPAVLKDHNACDPVFARVLGPLLAWREARALLSLRSVAAVPNLLARPDKRSLLLQYLPGEPLHKTEADVDWQAFFNRLREVLAQIHAHGVAHCDLRSPGNTLVNAAQTPVVVDLVAAVKKGASWNLCANWVFDRFCRADEQALLKLKRHVAPELLSEQEQSSIDERTGLEKAARWFGGSIRRISRRMFTRVVP